MVWMQSDYVIHEES